MRLICPVCGDGLLNKDRSLICEKNHCFDKAKSGYVNLLLSKNLHSKAPGDNRLMVESRSSFLSTGYYNRLKEEFCKQIVYYALQLMKLSNNEITLLDAGCGEGYYTHAAAEALEKGGINASIAAIDISKEALKFAAGRMNKSGYNALKSENGFVTLAAASCFELPVADESCDILTELFAPFCHDEFYRVIKKGGIMALVIPSVNHLYELKAAVYEKPYKNEVKEYEIEGFKLLSKTEVFDKIKLESNRDIKNLFMMTPYYYKTSKEDAARLDALSSLETRIEFEILIYEKSLVK